MNTYIHNTMGQSQSNTFKHEKMRREYNDRLYYTLDKKLQRYQEHNPLYHGEWARYKQRVDLCFSEDMANYVSSSQTNQTSH